MFVLTSNTRLHAVVYRSVHKPLLHAVDSVYNVSR